MVLGSPMKATSIWGSSHNPIRCVPSLISPRATAIGPPSRDSWPQTERPSMPRPPASLLLGRPSAVSLHRPFTHRLCGLRIQSAPMGRPISAQLLCRLLHRHRRFTSPTVCPSV
jgi:hypothetical protein